MRVFTPENYSCTIKDARAFHILVVVATNVQLERRQLKVEAREQLYIYMNGKTGLQLVAWPSWSKALDLSILDSQWARVRASSNLAATMEKRFFYFQHF